MPSVSIIIPNHNRAGMLQDAIRSVLAQTYQDFEIVVVDDGSTEDIPSALEPFGNSVHYIYTQNGGPALARNLGLNYATGRFIAFLDNDDLWLPRKLERQVEVLERQQTVGMVSCQAFLMDEHVWVLVRAAQGSARTTPVVALTELAEHNVIVGGGSSAMVRVEAIRAIGGFDTGIRFVEDWDCWLRIARNWQVWIIPDPLSYYRINPHGHRNHAPSPAQADAVHLYTLRVLAQAFATWPRELDGSATTRARAYAREYLRHAFVLYALGRQAEGRAAWEQAITCDANITTDLSVVRPAVIGCAAGYAMGADSAERSELALNVLASVLSDLPPSVRCIQNHRAHLEAALLAELAFLAAQEGDPNETRLNTLRCIAWDTSWIRNIGLIKLLISGGTRYWPTRVQEHMRGFS